MSAEFQALYNKAREAGLAAGNACSPRPMVVGSPSTPFGNDIDPRQPCYFEAEGVCGFAWVKVPGNIPFGRWLKKNALARPSHPAGLQIWVRDFGQSMQRKEAYAEAFAKVLKDGGISGAYADSRMD